MKIHEYREMMRYLTRKPLSDREVELAYTDHMQKLNSQAPMPVASNESFANEERMGFAKAGLASNEPVKAGELLSYLKKYGVDIHPGNMARAAQMYGIESPSSGKYILPPENKIKTIKDEWYKNQQRAPATTEIGRENFNERSKLVKELIASEKYNPSEMKDIIQKKYNVDMGNTIQKEINEARKRGKIIPSAKVGETSTNTQKLLYDINLLNENKKIKSILSNPELDFEKDYSKIVNEVKDTLKINDSKANYRLAYLLQAYSDGKIPSNKNIINNSNKVTASITENRPFGSLGSVLRRKLQVEPGVASQINEDPKYFSKSRKEISRKLPGGYATDEIKGLASSFENLTGRYSVFVQGIKGDINLNKGRTIDKLMNTTEKQLQNLDTRDVDYLDKRETIKDKYNERVKEFTNKYNKDLKKGELPVRGLELSFDTPKNSLARYNELKKINPDLIEGVEDIYNKYNYSFKVPADVKTIPEALGFVKSPEGQKLMQKAADVNAARVYADPTGIGNVLETSFGKALIEKAPSFVNALGKVAKATGAEFNALLGIALNSDELKELGFSDLETIGRAAYKGATEDLANFGSMIYSAVAEAPFSKEPYFETVLQAGDRFKFAREGAKESAEKRSTKERVDKIAEYRARKKFEQNYSESSYNPPTKEEFQKATELEKEGIFKEGLFSKKLYYEEEPKVNLLDKNIPTIFGNVPKEDEQFNFAKGGRVKFASGSDDPESDLYIPPLDKSEETFKEGIYNTKRLGPEDSLSKYKSYSELELLGNIDAKKPNYEILEDYIYRNMPTYEPKDVVPKGSRPVMPNEYNRSPSDGILNLSVGGRVGFKDGPEDPNKLIPIDPLLQDQSPTDPGRRDVLKLGIAGAGLLGLGKLGLLKLGSVAKPSIIAEAVKGTTAPSWMEGLMTKILKEGTEIKMPKESSIIKKEVQFKNPETGDVQTATLTIDPKSDRMFVEYNSSTNVADQPVVLELYRERKSVTRPDGKSFYLEPDKTKGYRFATTESGPRVTDWDGNIEFDAEDTYFKIIDLKSDISGLKSYATEGKGINKKVAKEKRAATKDVEENPHEYVPDNYPDTKYYPND